MPFNSRSALHKTPYGAVRAGEDVTLRLLVPRSLAYGRVFLHMDCEFSGRKRMLQVPRTGLCGGSDRYELTIPTKGLLGPVWYHFAFERAGKHAGFLGPEPGDTGGPAREYAESPPSFQLTVYEKEDTPDWFGAGVTYQVFPDRFHRLRVPAPKGMVGNRRVHKEWRETPDYLPDKNGEVRNCDFFGGSLQGVAKKLPYLHSLGVTCIYFSPVFEAASNHRYDTADYTKIDPMLGTEKDFSDLCEQAARLGISVILDGVFNHTGYDSVYFNGRGTYPEPGAAQSQSSRYYPWYSFQEWPKKYSSWWGVYTLPQVNESHPDYLDFIVTGERSVIRKWLRLGARGWRLDVADELPDSFIEKLKTAAREEKKDAVVIGEVWEDASNKVAYSERRRYLLGRELDGVMNYPFRDAAIAFVMGGAAEAFESRMEQLRENYPRACYYSLMNFLGTHDTPRILTVLGATGEEWAKGKAEKAALTLPPQRRELALSRLRVAAAILYAFPGSPMVYYGDEAGLEGFEDPFNRRGFPWGEEDKGLVAWFSSLGRARAKSAALRRGGIEYIAAGEGLLAFLRACEGERLLCLFNRTDKALPFEWHNAVDVITGTPYGGAVPPMSAAYLSTPL
ncbi:MAG: glycoside hydrolase family 13 protein [Oscillospiraceae bacterium]|jgi:glycosidase|nr:glycoside hydrolase family 13 protein [Oscillospiraceae bacterium]